MIADSTIRAIVDAILREQRHRTFLAELRERQRYARRVRKQVAA